MLGFNRHIKLEHYLLVVKFDKPDQMININVRATLKAILFNPEFTLFVLLIRAFGCVVTLLTGFCYAWSYCRVSQYQRLVEQKLVLVMSVLVFLFNDPLYVISVLFPNQVRYLSSNSALWFLLCYSASSSHSFSSSGSSWQNVS